MSALLTGLLGVAVRVAPDIFKVLAADRDEGDVREEAAKIVADVADTTEPDEANKKLDADPVLEAKLREKLAELEGRALKEQEAAEEEIEAIDKAFLEIEDAKRKQAHDHHIAQLEAQLKSVESARDYALNAAGHEKKWVRLINPVLAIMISLGFVSALALILFKRHIENVEVFFTAIGALGTGFATVIGFYFGSSSGSKQKDELIIAAPPEEAGGGGAPAEDLDQKGSPPQGAAGDDRAASRAPYAAPAPIPAPSIQGPLPDPGGRFGLFRQKAPGIMQDLINDFDLTIDQAAGVLGNLGHECAGFRKLQEISPTVQGSRGGWGWAQWTGPRRRAFEKWCREQGLDVASDEANYGFLKHELQTTESRALRHLKETNSLRDATRSFMEKFERPGVPHLDSRISWAREALAASEHIVA